MCITRRGLYLGVAQDLADHRQALPERQRARRKAVPQVVDPDARQAGPRPDALPGRLEVNEMRAPLSAGYDPGIAPFAREIGQ